MKKLLSLALTIVVVLSLCACGSPADKLTGNWVCEGSYKGYPDQMTLNEDGTGIVEGYSCNWTAEDGVLTLAVGNILIGTLSYEYEIDGSVLYLDGYAYELKGN